MREVHWATRGAFIPGMTYAPFSIAMLAASLVTIAAHAAENGERFPRFASFKTPQTFMREGPSKENRVKWVYRRRGLPVEVLAKYDVWRRVRDSDGEIGWVHAAMLSTDRTVLVVGPENAVMREDQRYGTPVVAEIQPGAVGKVTSCGRLACEVLFGNVEGWVDRSRLYGVYVDELF
jgi:SH3-like domain-containing protein